MCYLLTTNSAKVEFFDDHILGQPLPKLRNITQQKYLCMLRKGLPFRKLCSILLFLFMWRFAVASLNQVDRFSSRNLTHSRRHHPQHWNRLCQPATSSSPCCSEHSPYRVSLATVQIFAHTSRSSRWCSEPPRVELLSVALVGKKKPPSSLYPGCMQLFQLQISS